MNAEIISVGTQLLHGEIVNSNNQFLSHELTAYGLKLTHMTTVSNDCANLSEALRLALKRSELIVFCSDLGDEGNYNTHNVICDVLDIPLELHNDSWERIREFFLNTCREMPKDIKKQAMLPRDCTVFLNEHGTAPGCAITLNEQQILILPSTPRELFPMFSDYVAPYLSTLVGGTIVSRTVGVFGLSEPTLTERLADLMSEANPSVVSYAKDGEGILRVTAHSNDRKSALALCGTVIEEIKKRLSVNIYGIDISSLQKAVVVLLLDKHMKIATAESCTAGLLSSRLTEVSGVSAVFECGVAAYSREIKHNILGVPDELIDRFGTVSPEVAGAMAIGARRVGNASLGISVTGVAGPDSSEGKPVGTVYIALADEKRVWVKKINIDALDGIVNRDSIRLLATSHALDLVRRYLEALPTVMAGGEILDTNTNISPMIPQGNTSAKKDSFLHKILPWKGDSKTDFVRKSIILAAFILLLASVLLFVYINILRPIKNENIYQQLENMYDLSNPVIPAENDTEYTSNILPQFYALYSRNSDIRGWIKIDGTNINYPVMRDTVNQYYQTHDFDKQKSIYGVPYFDKQTKFISSDYNNRSTIIYGNNAKNGQMFSDLTNYYNNLDFLRAHPIIKMDTIFYTNKWQIFSVMIVSTPNDKNATENKFDYTRNVFKSESDFHDFVSNLNSRSLYTISTDNIQQGDSLLLLSTDFEAVAGYQGARLVVAASRLHTNENDIPDLSNVSYNDSAIMPPEWTTSIGTTTKNTRSHKNRITQPNSNKDKSKALDGENKSEQTTVSTDISSTKRAEESTTTSNNNNKESSLPTTSSSSDNSSNTTNTTSSIPPDLSKSMDKSAILKSE